MSSFAQATRLFQARNVDNFLGPAFESFVRDKLAARVDSDDVLSDRQVFEWYFEFTRRVDEQVRALATNFNTNVYAQFAALGDRATDQRRALEREMRAILVERRAESAEVASDAVAALERDARLRERSLAATVATLDASFANEFETRVVAALERAEADVAAQDEALRTLLDFFGRQDGEQFAAFVRAYNDDLTTLRDTIVPALDDVAVSLGDLDASSRRALDEAFSLDGRDDVARRTRAQLADARRDTLGAATARVASLRASLARLVLRDNQRVLALVRGQAKRVHTESRAALGRFDEFVRDKIEKTLDTDKFREFVAGARRSLRENAALLALERHGSVPIPALVDAAANASELGGVATLFDALERAQVVDYEATRPARIQTLPLTVDNLALRLGVAGRVVDVYAIARASRQAVALVHSVHALDDERSLVVEIDDEYSKVAVFTEDAETLRVLDVGARLVEARLDLFVQFDRDTRVVEFFASPDSLDERVSDVYVLTLDEAAAIDNFDATRGLVTSADRLFVEHYFENRDAGEQRWRHLPTGSIELPRGDDTNRYYFVRLRDVQRIDSNALLVQRSSRIRQFEVPDERTPPPLPAQSPVVSAVASEASSGLFASRAPSTLWSSSGADGRLFAAADVPAVRVSSDDSGLFLDDPKARSADHSSTTSLFEDMSFDTASRQHAVDAADDYVRTFEPPPPAPDDVSATSESMAADHSDYDDDDDDRLTMPANFMVQHGIVKPLVEIPREVVVSATVDRDSDDELFVVRRVRADDDDVSTTSDDATTTSADNSEVARGLELAVAEAQRLADRRQEKRHDETLLETSDFQLGGAQQVVDVRRARPPPPPPPTIEDTTDDERSVGAAAGRAPASLDMYASESSEGLFQDTRDIRATFTNFLQTMQETFVGGGDNREK